MAYSVGTAFVSVTPSLRGFQQKVTAELKSTLTNGVKVAVTPEVDATRARTEAATAARGMAQTVSFKAELDKKSLSDSIIGVAALSRAMSTLALPTAIVAATPYIASLGASAVQASGSLWLLPAAATAGGIAFAALKVGMAGFGDAMKELDDPEKFAEAIAKLSPAAREAATTIRGLVPAWTSMQQVVQQNLFAGVAGSIRELAGTYLPMLTTGLGGTATALNTFVRNFAAFAMAPQTLTDVPYLFSNINLAISNLAPAVNNVLGAFRDIAVVGSTFLPGLSLGIVGATQKFQTFIHTARETGQLAVWIQNGINTLKLLGQLTVNVGMILGSVFGAAQASGEPFLNFLVRVTGTMATALRTPEGAAGLAEFFTTIRTLVGLLWDKLVILWPAISAAGQAFAALLVAAAPLTAVIFSLVVSGLVPLLNTVQFLAPVLGPLIPIIFSIMGVMRLWTMATTAAAIAAPILSGAMWLLTAAVNGSLFSMIAFNARMAASVAVYYLKAAATSVATGAQWLFNAAMTSSIAGLVASTASMVAQRIAMVASTVAMYAVRAAVLAWTAVQWLLNAALLANPIGLVVIAIAALVAALVLAWQNSETFRAIVTAVWNGILAAVSAVVAWFQGPFVAFFAGLGVFFANLWNGIRNVSIAVWNAIAAFFTMVTNNIINFMRMVWTGLGQFFGAVWTGMQNVAITVWNAIAAFLTAAINGFSAFFSAVWNGISSFFGFIWNALRNTATVVWNAIAAFLTAAINAFSGFFTAVWNSISAFFGFIWNALRNTAVTIWNAIGAFLVGAINAFAGFFGAVWNGISAFFSFIWGVLRNTAITVWNAIAAFFGAAFAAFSAFFSAIWNAIVGFFVFTWNRLRDTAVNAWNFLWGFFSNAFSAFTRFFSDTWNNIVGTFDRIWSGIISIADRVWRGISDKFKEGINFVIGLINGFAGAINKVAGLLGFNINLGITPLATGGAIPRSHGGTIHRARGGATGQLPGYSPGVDTIPAMSRSGQRYILAGGEYIVRPEATRAIGPSGMAAINNAHRSPVGLLGDPALYANGGVIPLATGGQLGAAAQRGVPGTRITSTHRPGAAGYHGRNQAADLAGPRSMDTGFMHRINRWIADNHGGATNELIFTPGINLLNGRPHRYNAGTRADHNDHVHWAMSGALGEGGGGVLGAIGGFFQSLLRPVVDGLLSPLRGAITPIRDDPSRGFGSRMVAGAGVKVIDFLSNLAGEQDAANAVPSGGAGAEQWRGVALDALRRTGQSASLVDRVLQQIQIESGGNPRAINLWDINARRGTPSKGLIQTIDPTFQRWRDRGLPNDPYHPLANIVAGIRYAINRYGAIQNIWPKRMGYDVGGTLAPGTGSYFNGTGQHERVLNPSNTRSFDTLVSMLSSGALKTGSDGATATEPSGPLIGSYSQNFYGSDAAAQGFDELEHRMRVARRGGVHRG